MNSYNPIALVVDDDPFIQMNASYILQEAGFQVREALTGDEAKDSLAQDSDHVVLLFSDVEMPGTTNGFALARHVAEHYPAIEIVIASGRASPGEGELPERATFISKPFGAAMVHDHLRGTLPAEKWPEKLRSLHDRVGAEQPGVPRGRN